MIGGLPAEDRGHCHQLPDRDRRPYRPSTCSRRSAGAPTSNGDYLTYLFVIVAGTPRLHSLPTWGEQWLKPCQPSLQALRKRGAPEEEKLSLEAIREVVRSEVGGSTAALRAEISQRMDRVEVETEVTAQLEKTLERLAAINNQQQEQQRTVEAIQGEQYSMNARLQALESKVHVLQTTGTSSTADTDFGGEKACPHHGGVGRRHA